MITGWVIGGLLAGISALFSLLPSWTVTIPSDSIVINYISNLNLVFPIGVAGSCAIAYLTLRAGLFVWNLSVWVLHQFWGSD